MSWTVREDEHTKCQIKLEKGFVTMLELAEELPHGSGIDGTWSVWVSDTCHTEFHNSYHAMNNNGMYCGWHDFKVVLFQHAKDEIHKLYGPCEGKVQVTYRKGDWDFKVVWLTGKLDDVGDWVHEGVSLAWEKFGIGKMRKEVLPEK